MTSAKQSGRRSRISPVREAEIYTTVVGVLRETGYEAMTLDAVAARAHTSKATLYRRWGGKTQLVAAALRHHEIVAMAGIDTGSLRGDLLVIARRMADKAEELTEIITAVAHAIGVDAELQKALLRLMTSAEDDFFQAMFTRAAQRGEPAADASVIAMLPNLILGALVARPLVEGKLADLGYLEQFMTMIVMPAIAASAR